MMTKRLFFQAIAKFFAGVAALALLLFLPAGTLHYPGAWLLMGILFIPMFIAGLVLMRKNPALLEKRLRAKEQQSEQKAVVALSAGMFVLGFVAAGLDFRFGWTHLPAWVSPAAAVLFFLSYLLYAEVLRENVYLSRTVEVQENQKVIDTGLYGIVRHPMYMATVILFISMPLVLSSLVATVIFLVYPAIIAKRIRNEEEVLSRDLPGYTEYLQKVRWRLIPYIW